MPEEKNESKEKPVKLTAKQYAAHVPNQMHAYLIIRRHGNKRMVKSAWDKLMKDDGII